MDYPIIVGHRGAKGMAPENTLMAFKIGCQYADAVECDVQLTKDNKLVIIHDEKIDRTSNGRGKVSELTYHELLKFDFGQGQKIPLFEDIFELVKENGKKFVVEIKSDSSDGAVKIAANLSDFIIKNNGEKMIFICSFWKEGIMVVKKTLPKIPAFIISDIELTAEELINKVKDSLSDGIATAYTFLNKDLVSLLHSNNYIIDAWTVNEPDDIDRMLSLGIDMITSDYPKLALERSEKQK